MRAWAVTARLAAAAASDGSPDAAAMTELAALGHYGVLTARWQHTQAVPPFVGPLRPRLPDVQAVQAHVEQAYAVATGLTDREQLRALWAAGEPPWHVWTLLGKVRLWPLDLLRDLVTAKGPAIRACYHLLPQPCSMLAHVAACVPRVCVRVCAAGTDRRCLCHPARWCRQLESAAQEARRRSASSSRRSRLPPSSPAPPTVRLWTPCTACMRAA